MSEEHKLIGTSLNPLFEQIKYHGKTITSLDDDWESPSLQEGNDYEE